MRSGHVAVVSQVLTDRIVQVTHANWSTIAGHRGQVENDVTVVDVSPKGDWSQVKVWYDPAGDLGTTVYPTYGFIYQAAQKCRRRRPDRLRHRRRGDREVAPPPILSRRIGYRPRRTLVFAGLKA